MAKITMPESTMTFVLRMVVIGWNEMSAVPMNPVQHRVHPGFGRCVERPMGTPCRDGNLTERLGLLRVPRQRLAAGTGKGITCFIDGQHPAGQAQLRLARSRPASSEEYETELGAGRKSGWEGKRQSVRVNLGGG